MLSAVAWFERRDEATAASALLLPALCLVLDVDIFLCRGTVVQDPSAIVPGTFGRDGHSPYAVRGHRQCNPAPMP